MLPIGTSYWCPHIGTSYWCPPIGTSYWCPPIGTSYWCPPIGTSYWCPLLVPPIDAPYWYLLLVPPIDGLLDIYLLLMAPIGTWLSIGTPYSALLNLVLFVIIVYCYCYYFRKSIILVNSIVQNYMHLFNCVIKLVCAHFYIMHWTYMKTKWNAAIDSACLRSIVVILHTIDFVKYSLLICFYSFLLICLISLRLEYLCHDHLFKRYKSNV